MVDSLKNKSFVRAVSELERLLRRYDILPREWALAMHVSFLAFGYDLEYKRKRHLHIVVNREKLSWRLSAQDKLIFEVTPPLKSRFTTEYYQFINKTGFDFDILAFPPTICRVLFKNSANYPLNHKVAVQIMSPLGNITMEAKFWKLYLDQAPEKLERIFGYYRQILKQALEKKDMPVYDILSKLMVKYEGPLAKKLAQKPLGSEKDGVLGGQVGNRGKVRGRVGIVKDIDNPRLRGSYDIIVARMTSPKLTPLLKKAKGLITDEGGSLCHAAIISRELDIPCVIGTKVATQVLKNGDRVELDATNGTVKILSSQKNLSGLT